MKDTIQISIRPSTELLNWLREQAEKEHRSVNGQVLYFLEARKRKGKWTVGRSAIGGGDVIAGDYGAEKDV